MLCRVTTDRMVADIFYPIFTPNITVLACFIQKIKLGGFAPTRASSWTPWWAYSSCHTPSCKKNKKRCAYISCGLSPDLIMFSILITSIRGDSKVIIRINHQIKNPVNN